MLDLDALTEAISNESQRGDPYIDDVITRLRDDDALDVPIEMTDLDVWCNYMNDDLYEMDVKVREFLRRTRYKRQAKGGYRTTVPVVFAWIFGRHPEPSDGAACRLLHELLRYYCTSYTGATTFHGKPVTRAYRFSKFSATNKRPYSIRLRLEEGDGSVDVFRDGPDSKVNKRSHRRRADS